MKRNQLSWVNPILESKATSYGNGIFAKERISPGETLAIFGGQIMTIAQEESLESPLSDYSLQIADGLVIGPAFSDQIGNSEFFNHSCEPNAGFKGQIYLVSMKNIDSGEEICFDYAMVISGPEPYEMECLCGREICRKKITNNDWESFELQKKYEGFFQYYIQEKINKKNVL